MRPPSCGAFASYKRLDRTGVTRYVPGQSVDSGNSFIPLGGDGPLVGGGPEMRMSKTSFPAQNLIRPRSAAFR
jgi:hypothetical protein